MFVASNPRASYLQGLGAAMQMDRRQRYLTGLLSRGSLGSFNPRTRYLSGPKRRGLFGLGQDDNGVDIFSSLPDESLSTSLTDPVTGITYIGTSTGTMEPVPFTGSSNPNVYQGLDVPTAVLTPNTQVGGGAISNTSTPLATAPTSYVTPAGTVAAVPAGYTVSATGQLVPATSIAGSSLTSWLNSSTLISGELNSTVLLWGGLGLAAFSLLSKKKKR
jgi:hypothetical protein